MNPKKDGATATRLRFDVRPGVPSALLASAQGWLGRKFTENERSLLEAFDVKVKHWLRESPHNVELFAQQPIEALRLLRGPWDPLIEELARKMPRFDLEKMRDRASSAAPPLRVETFERDE